MAETQSEREFEVPEDSVYADWYRRVNKQTGEESVTIFDPDEPLAWIESDVACDLEGMA